MDNCLTEDDANMQEITGKIRDFFNRYESRINRALEETLDSDATETAEAFSDFSLPSIPMELPVERMMKSSNRRSSTAIVLQKHWHREHLEISHLITTFLDEFHWANEVSW